MTVAVFYPLYVLRSPSAILFFIMFKINRGRPYNTIFSVYMHMTKMCPIS